GTETPKLISRLSVSESQTQLRSHLSASRHRQTILFLPNPCSSDMFCSHSLARHSHSLNATVVGPIQVERQARTSNHPFEKSEEWRLRPVHNLRSDRLAAQ